MNGTTNGTTTRDTRSIPGPLRTAPDMPSRWDDVELGFDEAADRIIQAHAKDGAAQDLPIGDLKTWAIAPKDGEFALVPLARHHEPRPLRAAAFSNLMTRVGAPSEFIRRLPAPLQLATTNWLLAEHNDSSSATLRLRGDEVAAVVSGRYAPMDPVELLDCVRTSLTRFGLLNDVRVRGVASGLVDNMRLILPSEEIAVKVGDTSNVGIDISTSSFGRSAIHVSPMVWRLVCTNGLRSPERRGQLSFRHVGDGDRLRAAIGEAIPSALAHARGLMTQWQRAVDFMVHDVKDLIDGMRELSISEKKGFEEAVKVEAEVKELPEHMPLYNLVNALTSTARAAAPARRLELEGLAGDVLSRHVGSGT